MEEGPPACLPPPKTHLPSHAAWRCQNRTQAPKPVDQVLVCSTVSGASCTQDNRGKHTEGIDGAKSLTPPQRLRLAGTLRLTSTATPLRRTWIPKRGSPDKRPLGIPTQHERARQTLVRQALEPEWEARLSPHTYGFRPGRSCWDAIAAVFHRIKFRPQYLLKVDIAQCFDRLDHAALLAKLQAPPGIQRQVRAWLRSGIMETDTFMPYRRHPARRQLLAALSVDRPAWAGHGHHPGLSGSLCHRLCR